jgi:hypothetical protein
VLKGYAETLEEIRERLNDHTAEDHFEVEEVDGVKGTSYYNRLERRTEVHVSYHAVGRWTALWQRNDTGNLLADSPVQKTPTTPHPPDGTGFTGGVNDGGHGTTSDANDPVPEPPIEPPAGGPGGEANDTETKVKEKQEEEVDDGASVTVTGEARDAELGLQRTEASEGDAPSVGVGEVDQLQESETVEKEVDAEGENADERAVTPVQDDVETSAANDGNDEESGTEPKSSKVTTVEDAEENTLTPSDANKASEGDALKTPEGQQQMETSEGGAPSVDLPRESDVVEKGEVDAGGEGTTECAATPVEDDVGPPVAIDDNEEGSGTEPKSPKVTVEDAEEDTPSPSDANDISTEPTYSDFGTANEFIPDGASAAFFSADESESKNEASDLVEADAVPQEESSAEDKNAGIIPTTDDPTHREELHAGQQTPAGDGIAPSAQDRVRVSDNVNHPPSPSTVLSSSQATGECIHTIRTALDE